MRPRLMSRGKPPGDWSTTPTRSGFNAAAAHEPRKAVTYGGQGQRLLRFNAAAAHEPRKGVAAVALVVSVESLQCGRGS